MHCNKILSSSGLNLSLNMSLKHGTVFSFLYFGLALFPTYSVPPTPSPPPHVSLSCSRGSPFRGGISTLTL